MSTFSFTKVPSDILESIASRFQSLRKSKKMSQTELSERSGVSLGSIKRLERTGQISLESLLKLVFILNRLSDFETILDPDKNLSNIEKLFSDKTRRSRSPEQRN